MQADADPEYWADGYSIQTDGLWDLGGVAIFGNMYE